VYALGFISRFYCVVFLFFVCGCMCVYGPRCLI